MKKVDSNATTFVDESKRLDRTDPLFDIVIEKADETSSIFHKYAEKESIGLEMFKELYKTFITLPNGNRGFVMMDGSMDIGILSQCQALQSLMILVYDFGLDFNREDLIDGGNTSIRDIMDLVIEDVLERIKLTKDVRSRIAAAKDDQEKAFYLLGAEKKYTFDVSPYESTFFTNIYSNIDTIRWVIPTFLLVLKYHAKIGEICQYEDYLISVIRHGLKYLNESFIDKREEQENADKLLIGWNFTKDCEEPSLYYTFAVCECWINMFNTFEKHLEYQEAIRRHKLGLPIDSGIEEEHKNIIKNYEDQNAAPDKGPNIFGKPQARFDENNELIRLYKRISSANKEEETELIEGTEYGELEIRCKAVAQAVWKLVREDLADAFYYNDLSKTISEKDILTSTTSDALFNSVYIINIMLDAGLDEDIKLNRDIAFLEAGRLDREKAQEARLKAQKYDAEYRDFYEICQLASQKAFRTYENLKKAGKEYIVDQFLVGFNEQFSKHQEAIKELRKRRMRVFSLLPLLIRTNNAISEYLVQYPQANMPKYLGYILENRKADKNADNSGDTILRWIWERDGYFSSSNYYFVFALSQFYTYYEKFEEKYREKAYENEAARKTIRAKYLEDLQTQKDGAIRVRDEKIRELEAAVKKAEAERDAKQTPLEDIVSTMIQNAIQQAFNTQLAPALSKLLADSALSLNVCDKQSAASEEDKNLSAAFFDFLMAIFNADITMMFKKKNMDDYIVVKDGLRRALGSYFYNTSAELYDKSFRNASKETADTATPND